MGGCRDKCTGYASVAQSVEQGTENPRVIGSIPIGGTTSKILSFIGKSCKQDFCDEYQIFSSSPQTFGSQIFAGAPITQKALSVCGRSSSGRAPPCQGGGSEFEPRRPLQHEAIVDAEMQRRWLFFAFLFCTELPKTPFCRRTEPSDCKNCAFPLAKRPGMRYSIATV